MNEKGTYSVEIREPTRGGADYTEDHHECDSPEEVRKVIAGMHEDEHIHSVLYYSPGQDCNPKDVTRKFV